MPRAACTCYEETFVDLGQRSDALNMLASDVGDSAGAPPAYERLKRQYAEGARDPQLAN